MRVIQREVEIERERGKEREPFLSDRHKGHGPQVIYFRFRSLTAVMRTSMHSSRCELAYKMDGRRKAGFTSDPTDWPLSALSLLPSWQNMNFFLLRARGLSITCQCRETLTKPKTNLRNGERAEK